MTGIKLSGSGMKLLFIHSFCRHLTCVSVLDRWFLNQQSTASAFMHLMSPTARSCLCLSWRIIKSGLGKGSIHEKVRNCSHRRVMIGDHHLVLQTARCHLCAQAHRWMWCCGTAEGRFPSQHLSSLEAVTGGSGVLGAFYWGSWSERNPNMSQLE